METESETMARIQAKARTQRCREEASYVLQQYGKQESVMLAILEQLLGTIAELQEGR
jgi:hypothetical protein